MTVDELIQKWKLKRYPECGPGWFSLLDEMFGELQAAGFNVSSGFSQIKEKWGTLRIYTYDCNVPYDIIHKYERKSGKVCESCGKPGELKEVDYWWSTLCEGCRNGL